MTLRPLRAEDLPGIAAILSEPEAALWWGEADEESLRDDYLGKSADDHAFSVELEGELIGIVAYWEENEPDYRHAGMDIALAAEHRGRGLGQDALRTLARHLIDERGHWRLTIDPDAENGFRPVGIMRKVEKRADGELRDGLLMDLLAEELR